MRLGVLGGTFDPVHLGHLIIAEEARACLGLEEVLFIPTGQPWLKGGRSISLAVHRVEMLRRALEGNPHFRLSTMEVERPGPSYTVDTLEELHRSRGEGLEVYFILGMDSLREFYRWREPRRVLELCTLVVARRPDGPPEDPQSLIQGPFPGVPLRLVPLRSPLIGISGTEIRRRVSQGITIRYRVPQAVEEYILGQGLYRSAT